MDALCITIGITVTKRYNTIEVTGYLPLPYSQLCLPLNGMIHANLRYVNTIRTTTVTATRTITPRLKPHDPALAMWWLFKLKSIIMFVHLIWLHLISWDWCPNLMKITPARIKTIGIHTYLSLPWLGKFKGNTCTYIGIAWKFIWVIEFNCISPSVNQLSLIIQQPRATECF